MRRRTLDIERLLQPDSLAGEIAGKWQQWHSHRASWLEEKRELRNYIFATDTKTTSNKRLPWSNSTTTPKLTQIYDNLKANYSAALFPANNWMRWEGDDKDSAQPSKVAVVQAYMENKLRQSKFRIEVDRCIDDFILYGNCFATVEFARDYTEDVEGNLVPKYIGPRLVRISPYDIVFNPTSSSFEDSPKIIRSVLSIGDVAQLIEDGDPMYRSVFDRVVGNRKEVATATAYEKSDGYIADGFGSIELYYGSGYVEVLTFFGDMYDLNEGILKKNRKITVVDRAYIIGDDPIASWLGSAPVFHAGWRTRPDNLWAMGPLDNLVGMQYRIDHLENLKADVFDQIALPMLKIRGDVESFTYQPGERIILGEEGDVAPLVPDTTALNADFQIQTLEQKMEELAGAPRQAMGIRTPGEKTAFEVQTLQNAASRIFEHKAAKFEMEFVEPVLNAMLESGRRNMDDHEVIKVLEDDSGLMLFKDITRDDIAARGKLVPIGARHFAERARRVQNIVQLQGLKQDQTIGVHLSGKAIAKLISEELGEKDLYGENIAVMEQMETQRMAQDAEADMMEDMEIAAEAGL